MAHVVLTPPNCQRHSKHVRSTIWWCRNHMFRVTLTIAGISTSPFRQPHMAANLDNHELSRLAATDLISKVHQRHIER